MLPGEIQALMAKVLFIFFATFMLCLVRARATEAPLVPKAQKVMILAPKGL